MEKVSVIWIIIMMIIRMILGINLLGDGSDSHISMVEEEGISVVEEVKEPIDDNGSQEDISIEDTREDTPTELVVDHNNITRYPVNRLIEEWGYCNNKGQMVLDYIYDRADDFDDGYAVVSDGGNPYIINIYGEKVLDVEFEEIGRLKDGKAQFVRYNDSNELVTGFVYPYGKIVDVFVLGDYRTNVNFTSHDLIEVWNDDHEKNYVNLDGEFISDEFFYQSYGFSEGMCMVVNSDYKCGFINLQGDLVIDYLYDDRMALWYESGFHNDRALVNKDDKYGYIDKEGNIVIDIIYDIGYKFNEGLAVVYLGEEEYYINTLGDLDMDPDLSYIDSFENGYAFVQEDEATGYYTLINTEGINISPYLISHDPGRAGYTFIGEWNRIYDDGIARLALHVDNEFQMCLVDIEDDFKIIWTME